jgi:hypothetical protein
MILNGSAHVFLILKKKKQQTMPKNDPSTQKNWEYCFLTHDHVYTNEKVELRTDMK